MSHRTLVPTTTLSKVQEMAAVPSCWNPSLFPCSAVVGGDGTDDGAEQSVRDRGFTNTMLDGAAV